MLVPLVFQRMQLAVIADLVVAEDVRAFRHVLAIADPAAAAAAVDAAPWPQAHASLPAAAASAAATDDADETDDADQSVHPAHCAWADRYSRCPAANIAQVHISLPRSICQHQRLLSSSISASSAYGQQAWQAELSASGVDNARVHPMVGTLRVASDATPHRAPVCVSKRNEITIIGNITDKCLPSIPFQSSRQRQHRKICQSQSSECDTYTFVDHSRSAAPLDTWLPPEITKKKKKS